MIPVAWWGYQQCKAFDNPSCFHGGWWTEYSYWLGFIWFGGGIG